MPATATQPVAASASATGVHAVGEAVAAAAAGVRHPELVLFFTTCGIPDAAGQASRAAKRCPVAGMTVSAALGDAGPLLDGCSAIAFDESVSIGVGITEHASSDLAARAFEATTAALAPVRADCTERVVILLADTASGDQADVVAGAYRAAGPFVPLAGGGAGGPEPAQFVGGRELSDTVVAIAIGSERPLGVGAADGCRPVGVPAIVTEASGRVLLELDGRPAETVYLEKLGHGGDLLTDTEFERLAVLHPLAQPELGGRRRIRHVLGRAHGGGLYLATAVPAQAAVEFMTHDPDLVIHSARAAVKTATLALDGRPPAAVLVFDCAGRKRALDDELEVEIDAVRSASGYAPAIAGGYTHGEIGRLRGAKGDRNHALVVVAVG